MADKFDLKAIISAVDKMTPTLKGIQRSVKLTHKTFRDIGREGKNLMGSLGLPAGIAFSAVAYGAVRAARAALEYAGIIQDAADRTNSSVQGFQVLSNLLAQVGGSAEDAEKAFDTFNRGVANAAAGTDKSFAGLLKKMKIPLRDAQGNLRSLEQVLPDVADAFAANKNPAIQARMATELFSKSGKKLIPILNGGRKAYLDWIQEQKRLGLIVSDDAVAGMDNLGDSIGVVNLQIKAQLTQSMAALVPVIQPILKDMSEWIAANKEWLRAEIVSTLKQVAQAIRDVDWRAVASGIKDAAIAVRDTVQALGGLKNVLIGIGVLFLAGPIASVLGIVGALWRFGAGLLKIVGGWKAISAAIMTVWRVVGGLTWLVKLLGVALMKDVVKVFMVLGRVLMANPIGLVITAIAGGAYLIYKNWDKLKSWFGQFWEWIKTKAASIGSIIAKALSPLNAAKWLTDKAIELTAPGRPRETSLAAAGRQQLTGDMTVRFENAPAGMRVNPGKTNQPGVSMNPDVGYRSLSLGY